MSNLILPYGGISPDIADDAFIAPNAAIIGDVVIGAQSSIWFGCTVRGDGNFIRIGARTNIQDGTVIHVDSDSLPAIIGDDVTVGHMALIHACTLESGSFVGDGHGRRGCRDRRHGCRRRPGHAGQARARGRAMDGQSGQEMARPHRAGTH